MKDDSIKSKLDFAEKKLQNQFILEYERREINNRMLVTYFSNIFVKNCKKGKVWKSPEFITTLKNLKYGFDESRMRSKSGRDGIFLVDRKYRPKNSLQKKIYDKFIDKDNSDFQVIVTELNMSENAVKGVRVVSHHMRLLGILEIREAEDLIVLIDFDRDK